LPALPPRHILNINIPDVAELQGAKITYQGRRRHWLLKYSLMDLLQSI
jgi:broad specificity polyphosphatase/5'/3'-nucleotidase SurE